jgi:hypothetical protein
MIPQVSTRTARSKSPCAKPADVVGAPPLRGEESTFSGRLAREEACGQSNYTANCYVNLGGGAVVRSGLRYLDVRERKTDSERRAICGRPTGLSLPARNVIWHLMITLTSHQHQAALDQAVELRAFLVSLDFPRNSLILADSRNGGHVVLRADLPDDAEATRLVERSDPHLALYG